MIFFLSDHYDEKMTETVSKLKYNKQYLAYKQSKFKSNHNVVFLGGYASDMCGTKAEFLHKFCVENKINFTRFDYFGHGLSSGKLANGTISLWLENALLVLDSLVRMPCIVIGSSMGGWLALLVALARPQLVKGIIGIAPAPDFTESLIWDKLSEKEQAIFRKDNFIYYGREACGNSLPFTYDLIQDGRKHLLLKDKIDITCPIYLLHGMQDKDVPYELSLTLAEKLASDDVEIMLRKNSEHRMSTEGDLAALAGLLQQMLLIID